jgi:hypothetical protein
MTSNLDESLAWHNAGENQSIKHYAPFSPVFYLAVKAERKAREMKKYFKSVSGKAFIKWHFLD